MVRDEIQIAAERDYAVRTGREEGLEEGHAAGLEEGKVKANIETARKMKADGLAIESIIFYTGLSVEEVEAL